MRLAQYSAIALIGMITLAGIAVGLRFSVFPFILIPIFQLPIPVVGAFLIARVPRNPVGWLLALSGVFWQILFAAGVYGWWALEGDPALPGGGIAASLTTLFAPALSAAIVAMLFFPSGRGLGGRWHWVERALILMLILGSIGTVFKDQPYDLGGPGPTAHLDHNPIAPSGVLGDVVAALSHLMDPITAPLMLLAPASLIVRYRRADLVQRQQIKWLAYVAAVVFFVFMLFALAPSQNNDELWSTALFFAALSSLGLLPIAIAIGILRYRLYDIDVVIERTLVYAALTALLGATYVAGIIGSEAVLRPLTGGNELAVAASTLLVVALFQPLRRRIQNAVDRRFYRARYDAERTLDAFAARLRDEVDLDDVRRELLAVIGSTVRPERAGVWLKR